VQRLKGSSVYSGLLNLIIKLSKFLIRVELRYSLGSTESLSNIADYIFNVDIASKFC
jgi:hypothetical protein